jgi:HKD family nuclease
MSSREPPHEGLYDQPITIELDDALSALAKDLPEIESLDAQDAPRALARLVHHRLLHALASFPSSSKAGNEDAIEQQLALTNHLLLQLEQVKHAGATEGQRLAPPARRLLAIRKPAQGLGAVTSPVRPTLPLSSSDLLVNGHRDVSLGPEVQREIASANRVDLLCSFLKWSGFRLVESALEELTRRHPGSLRILTTAYMSATDRRALDALTELGAQVRVSYDTTRTRLHAKAWLFHRDSAFSTATVGSSNLSAAAMLDGLEWNVRLSQIDNGPILEKFRTTFEQYWADPEFQPYDGDQFDEAIGAQKNRAARHLFVFDLSPRPHQTEMLEALESERDKGHHSLAQSHEPSPPNPPHQPREVTQ